MYFEFSQRTITPLLVLVAALSLSVVLFLVGDKYLLLVDNTVQFLQRQRGDLAYQFAYNMPWNTNLAAVGARGATASASTTTSGTAQAIPVLLYHGTPPEGTDNPPLPQSVFVDQLRALKAEGWETITLEEFHDFMKKDSPLPAKSFLLTFDDGRRESFYPTDPVLKDLGYNAVMFVITGFSLPAQGKGSPFYLDQNELAHMHASGRWDIQSHGAEDHRLYDVPSITPGEEVETIPGGHFLSNKFWLQDPGRIESDEEFATRIDIDMRNSKETLERVFEKPITAFAFPFSDFGQNTFNFPEARDIVAEVIPKHYTFAFYQVDPTKEDSFNYPDPEMVMIKRIEPLAVWSGADLVAILNRDSPKNFPYHNGTTWEEWDLNWGNLEKSETLTLFALPTTSGAAALINGSAWWQDYTLSVTVALPAVGHISLIARYQSDSEPFLSCAFSDNSIRLEAHAEGKQTNIALAPYTARTEGRNVLTMSVVGNKATCRTQGAVAEARVDTKYVHSGNAGISIWDPNLGSARLQVESVSANAL